MQLLILKKRKKDIEEFSQKWSAFEDRMSYVVCDEDGVYDERHSFFSLDEAILIRDMYDNKNSEEQLIQRLRYE